jgi:16S rRNA (cytosine967-C5)-methyltransferase
VVQADASGPLPFASDFDCVLLDAPCSGLGTLRRDPDIKWRRLEHDLPRAADLQIRLLDSLAGSVRPGGRLVYVTCSSEPDENDLVVRRFLEVRRDFTIRPLAGQPAELESLVEPSGFFRTLPFRDGLEAFFAAALARG